eukprot:gene4836-4992_t
MLPPGVTVRILADDAQARCAAPNANVAKHALRSWLAADRAALEADMSPSTVSSVAGSLLWVSAGAAMRSHPFFASIYAVRCNFSPTQLRVIFTGLHIASVIVVTDPYASAAIDAAHASLLWPAAVLTIFPDGTRTVAVHCCHRHNASQQTVELFALCHGILHAAALRAVGCLALVLGDNTHAAHGTIHSLRWRGKLSCPARHGLSRWLQLRLLPHRMCLHGTPICVSVAKCPGSDANPADPYARSPALARHGLTALPQTREL